MSMYRMKSIVPIMYINMKVREDLKKTDFDYELTDEQFKLLRRLGILLMETNFTSQASKIYMQNTSFSQVTVAVKLGIDKIDTVKSRIRYDNVKLKREVFNGDIVHEILNSTKSLAIIDKRISELLSVYPRLVTSINKLLIVPLPEVKEKVYCGQITDDDFELIKASAIRISKKNADNTIEKLGDKGVAYLTYLLDEEPIDSIDIKRKRELIEFLSE